MFYIAKVIGNNGINTQTSPTKSTKTSQSILAATQTKPTVETVRAKNENSIPNRDQDSAIVILNTTYILLTNKTEFSLALVTIQ